MQIFIITKNYLLQRFVYMAMITLSAGLLAACAVPREKGATAPRETIDWSQPPAEHPPSGQTMRDAPGHDAPGQPATEQTGASGPCREFQETVMIGGKPQKAYGTACRQPDGTWKRVSSSDKPTTQQPAQSYPYRGYPAGEPYNPPYAGPRPHIGIGFGHHGPQVGVGVQW